ncbi:MAG: hypothetical protein FWC96_09630 [Oscillospiraceae bacterium]|nr:hypothetical protein [Oscillospiraceae bacterium]
MIIMAGIDYNLASIDLREKFSFTDETLTGAYERLKNMPEIRGAVLISTCNRTELYVSSGDDEINAFGLLRDLAGVVGNGLSGYTANGLGVMRHLCGLAGGLKSQILGEDQIIAQVKEAIKTARELRAVDSILEVLFRESIAAAKMIKSKITLGTREDSIVHRALEAIEKHGNVKRALVIGNGEIGRLMTKTLVENGYHTTMTLRTYRHGETLVPPGTHTVNYAARYDKLSDCDVLISATRSPHYTIVAEQVRKDTAYPKLWLDLAVPRDIDPEIVMKLPDAVYYDVDTLSAGETYQNRAEKETQASEIIEKYVADFEKWLSYQHVINGQDRKEFFPLFISSRGKKALIVGGGKVAARRVKTLLQFEFEVTVVAPESTREIHDLHNKGRLTLITRQFNDTDLDGVFLTVAATNNREVNQHMGKLAAQRGIFASIADKSDECGFLFPAIAISGNIVAGLTSGGKSHHAVVQAARKVREIL